MRTHLELKQRMHDKQLNMFGTGKHTSQDSDFQ